MSSNWLKGLVDNYESAREHFQLKKLDRTLFGEKSEDQNIHELREELEAAYRIIITVLNSYKNQIIDLGYQCDVAYRIFPISVFDINMPSEASMIIDAYDRNSKHIDIDVFDQITFKTDDFFTLKITFLLNNLIRYEEKIDIREKLTLTKVEEIVKKFLAMCFSPARHIRPE